MGKLLFRERPPKFVFEGEMGRPWGRCESTCNTTAMPSAPRINPRTAPCTAPCAAPLTHHCTALNDRPSTILSTSPTRSRTHLRADLHAHATLSRPPHAHTSEQAHTDPIQPQHKYELQRTSSALLTVSYAFHMRVFWICRSRIVWLPACEK
jgi:hypothetical protein